MQVLFVLNNGKRTNVDFMEIDEGTTVKRLIRRKGLRWNSRELAVRVNRRVVAAEHPLEDGDRITATARPVVARPAMYKIDLSCNGPINSGTLIKRLIGWVVGFFSGDVRREKTDQPAALDGMPAREGIDPLRDVPFTCLEATHSPPSALVRKERLPADAEAAASRLEVTQYVPVALELLGKCFSGIKAMQFVPGKDPETEEEWLSIEVTVEGDIDSVSESFNAYTKQWVERVPWPYGSRICLSYNIGE